MSRFERVRLLESLARELNRRALWRQWVDRVRVLFEQGDGSRRLYPVQALGLPRGDPEFRQLVARMAWAISDSNAIVIFNVAARDVLDGRPEE